MRHLSRPKAVEEQERSARRGHYGQGTWRTSGISQVHPEFRLENGWELHQQSIDVVVQLDMNRHPPGIPRPVLTAVVAGLLALHWWWALTALIGSGMTNDEPMHLTAGYSYWRFNDYRLQPENGNLPQRWAALPLLLLHPRLDPADEPALWARSNQWRITYNLSRDGQHPSRVELRKVQVSSKR